MRESMFQNIKPIEAPVSGVKREIERPMFERQLAIVKIIDGIEMVDIMPEKETGKTPVVFAPGFARTTDSFSESLRTLHERGRHTLSLNQPREGGEINQDEFLEGAPKEVLRRATSLLKVIKEGIKDGQKVNLVGQSLGGMDAVVAALMAENEKPGQIDNIVLVDPAGMIGKDSIAGLAKRYLGDQLKENKGVASDPERSVGAKENMATAKVVGGNYIKEGVIRALTEAKSMTEFRIEELLVELKRRGVGISIVQGVDDVTFPMGRMQANARSEQFDGFYSVKGGHNELYYEPEKYMGLVEEALTALENKKSARELKEAI